MHLLPSIGICVIDGTQHSADDLFKQADIANRAAKSACKSTLSLFSPKMQTKLDGQTELERHLRQAVARKELVLHFQPVVSESGQVTSAEALIRWLHPKRGMVLPCEFIPLAEKSGLILPIGEWVLKNACHQLSKWQRDGFDIDIAINVSARQFNQDDFVGQVLRCLRESEVDPTYLKLELTESIPLLDVNAVIEKMHVLKAHGVHVALDDFGTGYSSLSYLQRLPLDQLKIDQSFVQEMLSSPRAAAIVCAIINLACNLGIEVIAEGVETVEQFHFLKGNGCRYYQGYYFSAPMPADQLARNMMSPGWCQMQGMANFG